MLFLVVSLTSFLNLFPRKISITEYGPPTPTTEDEEISKEEESVEEEKEIVTEPVIAEGQLPTLPSTSIILTPRDNAQEFAENLPSYLNQDYSTDFQVIAVVPQNNHKTSDVSKRSAPNSHLHTTFIPESSCYMSKKKSAIMPGAKAAKCDWVIMADTCCYPRGDNWLRVIARNCQEDKEFMVGYTRYEGETSAYRYFKRHYLARYFMREYQYNKSYACPFNTLAFRKSRLLSERGFRGDLRYVHGGHNFMINKYVSGSDPVLENSSEETLIEEAPTEKA